MSDNSPADSAESVDFEVLLRLKEQTWDGEEDLVPELIEAFLEEVPENCVELEQLVSAGDAVEVRKKAHYMRSSTSNLGANKMTAMCAGLEKMAHAGSLEGADDVVRRLNAELSLVRAGFERYLTQQAS